MDRGTDVDYPSSGDALLRSAGMNPRPAPVVKPYSTRVPNSWAVFADHRLRGWCYELTDAHGVFQAYLEGGRGAVFDDRDAALRWIIEWAETQA